MARTRGRQTPQQRARAAARVRTADALLGELEELEARRRATDAEQLVLVERLREVALNSRDGNAGSQPPAGAESAAQLDADADGDVDGDDNADGETDPLRDDAEDIVRGFGVGGEVSHRSLRLELSAALGQSEHMVDRLLSLAFSMTQQFPGTLAALKSGVVSREHVQVIADAGRVLGQGESRGERERRSRYECEVLRVAGEETPNRLRPIAQRIAAALCEMTLVERHREALLLRGVRIVDAGDGMADLIVRLAAEDAVAVKDRVTRLAKNAVVRVHEAANVDVAEDAAGAGPDAGAGVGAGAGPDAGADAGAGADVGADAGADVVSGRDARTLDHIRADVLRDLLLGRDVPGSEGIRGHIQVIVPETLLTEPADDGPMHPGQQGSGLPVASALDPPAETADTVPTLERAAPERAAPKRSLARVGELVGHGVIDAETAARLAIGAREQDRERVAVTGEGAVLRVERYVPSAEIRRRKRAEDVHCRAPGCRVPAIRCDLDHTVDAARGGATSTDNLAHLCRGHHVVKHHGGWDVTQNGAGAVRWVSPTGRGYVQRPPGRVRFVSLPVHPSEVWTPRGQDSPPQGAPHPESGPSDTEHPF